MIQYSTRIYDILLLKFKYNPSYLSLIKVSEKKNEGTIIRAYVIIYWQDSWNDCSIRNEPERLRQNYIDLQQI